MSARKARALKAILDAAEAQFNQHGFYATTMESIARAADMAVGSLYFYFTNKDSLYYATLERGLVALESALSAALAALPDDARPIQRLDAMGDAYVRFAFEHVSLFRMLLFPHTMTGAAGNDPVTTRHNEIMKERTEYLLQLMTSGIEQAFSQGKQQPIAFDHAARFLFGAWNGVIALYLRDDTLRLDKEEIMLILDEARWVLWQGVAVVVGLPDSARADFQRRR